MSISAAPLGSDAIELLIKPNFWAETPNKLPPAPKPNSPRPKRYDLVNTAPERMYPDKGCVESETCLTCPLPKCKYDDMKGYLEYRRWLRDQKLRRSLGQLRHKASGNVNVARASRINGVVKETMIAAQKHTNQRRGF